MKTIKQILGLLKNIALVAIITVPLYFGILTLGHLYIDCIDGLEEAVQAKELISIQEDVITILAGIDLQRCTDRNKPLLITVENISDKEIKTLKFNFKITASNGTRDISSNQVYLWKKDIKPNEIVSQCSSYSLWRETNFIWANLEFEPKKIEVDFKL